MDQFRVYPSSNLSGEVTISGAKNSVLPIMAATLLGQGVSRIDNVPDLKDVRTMCDVMRVIGAQIQFQDNSLKVDTTFCNHFEAPYELVKTMRASIYVLGPLVAKHGYARVSLPGGCAWGPRPVDLHIKGLEAIGATIKVSHGYIEATSEGLSGGDYHFPISSVGASANVIMAAVLAQGPSTLQNVAIEPEIDQLCEYLVSMGAIIAGIGTRTLKITGVAELSPGQGKTIPDRIEAGTFLAAAAITRSKIKINAVNPKHLKEVLNHLESMGVLLETTESTITIDATQPLTAKSIETQPYPGFPTDLQAPFMALLASIPGNSFIRETIYLDRFKHLSELDRLGAKIKLNDSMATIEGGEPFSAAPVMASDLRAGAALVLAGLIAEGNTEVSRIYHMDRGYENFEAKMAGLGAQVERIQTSF